MTDEVHHLKQQMRVKAAARRAEQPNGECLSHRIFQHVAALPEYVQAQTVMLYLDFRTEVRTRWFLPTAWAEGKRIVVPYCEKDEIELFRLDSLNELARGAMGVPEPKPELRACADRKIHPLQIDLIIAPGLAFDLHGGRLGYGKAYYDRFLQKVRADAAKVAICFQCQLFPEVPSLPHDVRMDMIVTEKAVHRASVEDRLSGGQFLDLKDGGAG